MIDVGKVQKPQRYIGNEWNVVKKPHADKILICISYPDLYEIGMSNLGLRILYGIFNDFPDVVCERVFAPADDYTAFLRSQNKRLTSLETKTELGKFDVLGFNFDYELNFTNFLYMLDTADIAIKARDRRDLIVLGGGMANPEPLAEFVDVFYLGEFEPTAAVFIEVLRTHKDKESRLRALSQIQGFYVPKFYCVTQEKNRYCLERIYPYARIPIERVTVKDLDSAYYPTKWLVPHTSIIHDRVPIEIARGCPNRCTFCQARALYYPYRERTLACVKNIARQTYACSGYEDFSFLALSASDHSSIKQLIAEMTEEFKSKRIGLSLPSLRIDDIIAGLYQQLIPLKRTSLTVAVEAANETLRTNMNKNIDINKLFEAAHVLRSLKLNHLKLYFMFGFPQETEEDLSAIGKFLEKLYRQSRINLNVSINIFVPKPFSLWQAQPMESEECLQRKRQIIFANIAPCRNMAITVSDTKRSILEAICSRADRAFSAVIYRAFLKGARFEGYAERFSWQRWEESMKEEEVDYRRYLETQTTNFPWSFITGSCSSLKEKC
ncbi:MAG: TIGR03960 family B12-binding radical SAM protein [Candidatus Omnitrophota bacterium]